MTFNQWPFKIISLKSHSSLALIFFQIVTIGCNSIISSSFCPLLILSSDNCLYWKAIDVHWYVLIVACHPGPRKKHRENKERINQQNCFVFRYHISERKCSSTKQCINGHMNLGVLLKGIILMTLWGIKTLKLQQTLH